MNSTSLANLDFGEQSITIYGTQTDPLIKCTDIIVKILKYKDSSKAKWFSDMRSDPDYVVTPQNGGCA